MLNNTQIASFLATANADAARLFYEQTLGLTFVADEPFALVFDANGISLRLQKVPEFTPHSFTSLGWEVTDIEAKVKTLQAKDVSFEQFPGLSQDSLGICTFPDGIKVAWFKDVDGNLLSLSEVAS